MRKFRFSIGSRLFVAVPVSRRAQEYTCVILTTTRHAIIVAAVATIMAVTLLWIGRRYSALSIAGVALIIAGAVVLAIRFIGSIEAMYGTAYGAMAATMSVLFGTLLLLGFANFRAVRRFTADSTRLARVRRFVEVLASPWSQHCCSPIERLENMRQDNR